jgi:hypothetical protein
MDRIERAVNALMVGAVLSFFAAGLMWGIAIEAFGIPSPFWGWFALFSGFLLWSAMKGRRSEPRHLSTPPPPLAETAEAARSRYLAAEAAHRLYQAGVIGRDRYRAELRQHLGDELPGTIEADEV